MKDVRFLPGLVLALFAVVMLPASAHSSAPGDMRAGNSTLPLAELESTDRVKPLHPEPSVLRRHDVLYPEDALSRSDPPALRSNTARFWLPDTLETGWLASDKKLHLLACYSTVLTGKVASDRWETGVIWAVGLSAGKELWDLWFKTPASHRGVSRRDLIADAVGIGAGIFVVQAFGE